MPTVLSIQSQVAGARVGNSIAVFALERLGVEVIALPTVVFGQRPDRGPPGGGVTPVGWLEAMLAALDAGGVLGRVDAVLSGYLGAPEQAEAVLLALNQVRRRRPGAIYVCDPVLGDADGGLYAKPAVAHAIRDQLSPRADLLTPNAFELSWLTGQAAHGVEDAAAAAKRLARDCLVTSAPTPAGLATLLCTGAGTLRVETPELPRPPKGTGDLLTALFVGRRLLGQAPEQALSLAVGAVYDLIAAADGDDLPVVAHQSLLVQPKTQPTVW